GREPGATFAATRLRNSVGDWCIGNTVVSKTAASGSTPGSPVYRTARKTTTFPAQASVSGPQRHLLRIRMDPHETARSGGGRSLAGHLQRTSSGSLSPPLGPHRSDLGSV